MSATKPAETTAATTKKARKVDPTSLAFKAYKLATKVAGLDGKLKTAVEGLTPDARKVFDKLMSK